ncbi:MAG TPA: radical SAM protein [Verrucomicrobiae bacterium]|nr:radical SAM protein [Verrucomicrobiae bacterium]
MHNRLDPHNITSLCPVCYGVVRGRLYKKQWELRIRKTCPVHGEFDSLVDPDAGFVDVLQPLGRHNNHFQTLFFNVTDHCNIRCKYCYYPLTEKTPNPMIDRLVREASETNYVILMTGGEPTSRKDLPEVVAALKKSHVVAMLTNGIALDDPDLVKRLADSGMTMEISKQGQTTRLFLASFSLHLPKFNGPENHARKLAALENIRSQGMVIEDVMFSVESLEDIPEAIKCIRELKTRALTWRIRGPGNIWAEHSAPQILYTSQMFNRLREMANAEGVRFEILGGMDNTLYTLSVRYDNLNLRLIQWPNEQNVVIEDLAGKGPYQKANNGIIENVVYAGLVNQGMAKGWLNGVKLTGEQPTRPTDFMRR